MKPLFPQSWLQPAAPAYGTFPWPFKNSGISDKVLIENSLEAIVSALHSGYRHIDTAFTYRNQDQIGFAARSLEIPRKEIYVSSKLHPNNNNYHDAIEKIHQAVDLIWGGQAPRSEAYLDAFFIHYPGIGDPLGAWRAMLQARDQGIVRHVGVSNFEIWHLKKLKEEFGEYPEINQIEFHPWIFQQQVETIQFCRANNILIEGYSPLAQAKKIKRLILSKLAEKYTTTSARILIKWCMQHNVLPVVGSRNPEHIRSNIEKYMFELSTDEMCSINDFGQSDSLRVSDQWSWNSKTAAFGCTLSDLKE